jgi:transcriptional regulator with XRE-family HTH domain
MTTKKKKSRAMSFLEDAAGGPLTLGGLLSAIREGEEESQVEFAERLGISKSHLCDIEKGRKMLSPARAAKFARTLRYSEAQFVRLALQDLVEEAGLDMRVQIQA